MAIYRTAVVEHLRESHRVITQLLEDADFDDAFPFVFGHPDDNTAELAVHAELALLLRKAQMHITAVIHANRTDNLHSIAVHTRVILECSAQVSGLAHAASEGSTKALRRVLNASEYDFRDSMMRMYRGRVTEDELHQLIIDARTRSDDTSTASPRKVTIAARLQHVRDGKKWYDFLSEHFCGERTGDLSGLSMFGGVVTSGTKADCIAIEVLLGYVAEYTALMLFSYGFVLIAISGDGQPFEGRIGVAGASATGCRAMAHSSPAKPRGAI